MGLKGLDYLDGLLQQRERDQLVNGHTTVTRSPQSPIRPNNGTNSYPGTPNGMIQTTYAQGWRNSLTNRRSVRSSQSSKCESIKRRLEFIKERIPLLIWILFGMVVGIMTSPMSYFHQNADSDNSDWRVFKESWDRDWYELGSSMHISIQLTEPLTDHDRKSNQLYPMDLLNNVYKSHNHYLKLGDLSDLFNLQNVYQSYLTNNIQSASYDGFYAISRQIKVLYRCAQAHFCSIEASDYNSTVNWERPDRQNNPLSHNKLGQLTAASYRINCPNTQTLRSFWQIYQSTLLTDRPIRHVK